MAVAPYSHNDFTQNTKTLVSQNATGAILVSDSNTNNVKYTQEAKEFKKQAEILGISLIDVLIVGDESAESVMKNI